jgi:Uma2 family endonuclease
MGHPALQLSEHFTYRQYRTWPDEERFELIDGLAWMMSAPSQRHQTISMRLSGELYLFLKGKTCMPFSAPFDVLLPKADEADDEVDSVVQPDIMVFCDPSRIRTANARGAPDLVVEILSPSTSRKDQNEKHRLYERAGVREYWVVDPAALSIWVYRLVEGGSGGGQKGERRFDAGILKEQFRDWTRIESAVLEGFFVDPGELFKGME